jgi:hypothetical protein
MAYGARVRRKLDSPEVGPGHAAGARAERKGASVASLQKKGMVCQTEDDTGRCGQTTAWNGAGHLRERPGARRVCGRAGDGLFGARCLSGLNGIAGIRGY